MQKFLITGAFGQDAFYLSKYIKREKLGLIYGIHNKEDTETLKKRLQYFDEVKKLSLDDSDPLSSYIIDNNFDYIINVGALASSLTQFDNPISLLKINSESVVNILDTIKNHRLSTIFLQASSCEIFAGGIAEPQQLNTPRTPRTLYGATKILSDNFIKIYREKYGIRCFSAILYSHESPLRDESFFTKNIFIKIHKYLSGEKNKIQIYNPNAYRDWGYAGDYAKILVKSLFRKQLDDLIVASGKLTSVKSFTENVLKQYDLDYNHVVEEIDSPEFRAKETLKLCPDHDSIEKIVSQNIKFDVPKLIKLLTRHYEQTK
ncbi:GDP-mannose 4,6-dehydratase [Gammaproteobacteria bacterium]|nr:GDP-mannose 4,6-dehydratase [Gammaproteobacteria bacterium]